MIDENWIIWLVYEIGIMRVFVDCKFWEFMLMKMMNKWNIFVVINYKWDKRLYYDCVDRIMLFL